MILVSSFSFAQNEKEIDSLNKIIKSKSDVIKKGEAYFSLFQIYTNIDLNKANVYLDKLYALNKDNSCIKCEILADYCKADLYVTNGDDKNAILYFNKSAQNALGIKDYDNYQNGIFHKIQSQLNIHLYKEAEKEINDLLIFKKKNKLDNMWHYFYYIRGAYNFDKAFYSTAIDDFIKGEKYSNLDPIDGTIMSITCLDRISMVYGQLKDYKKSIEYNEKALAVATKENILHYIMYFSLQRGVMECELNNYNKALPYLTKAYNHFSSLGSVMFTSNSALFLGRTYLGLKDYPQSTIYIDIAINEFTKQKNNAYLGRSYVTKSKIDIAQDNYGSAQQNLDKAKYFMKSYRKESNYIEIITAEIEFYKKTKDIENLLKSIDSRDSMRVEISKKTNLNSINEVETKYQTEKKEQQIKLLSTKNELAQKQKYIYISLLALLLLIGGSLFYGYRNKIKTAKKLNELNELKSRFFANISHEFRTPLTLIKSPVQSLKAEISNKNQFHKLDLIENNSNRMLELVDQLLELSKLDSGKLKLFLKEGNVTVFLNSLIDSFVFQAKEHKLTFISNVEKNTENQYFDKDVIEKIVTNLLSNAIKYSSENETITFDSKTQNNELKILISNSGSTIKEEEVPKLFERFYQKDVNQQGFGIGLALVKELIELYNGKIETTINNGILSFSISLPLEKSEHNAIKISTKINEIILETVIESDNELPILLIVDDNSDIRKVLKEIFKNEFQIFEAEDGLEAFKKAKKEIPDCIISDVMMPKMDGFEFTKAIKNDELTSFIPVVLLTAKTSDESHLEGLKSTADAYLTKPFNNEIVIQTVKQLIFERKKLHKRYSQELVLRPSDIVINSVDEKFIGRLQKALDQNVSNADYSTDDFARDAGLSRMQLHRKLKTLFGVSATEFLRNERLKIAAELLKKGNVTISDVAYAVGFNDLSYFSKCFKEMHQCTPTEYIEKEL